MGINPTTFTASDDLDALGSDVEGGHSQEEPEAREGTDRANLRLLEIPPVGWVVEKGLFDIKTQTVFLDGVQGGGFIADDGPKLAIDVVMPKRNLHGTGLFPFVQFHGVPTAGFSPLQVNGLQLAPPVAHLPNPAIALDADTVVPP